MEISPYWQHQLKLSKEELFEESLATVRNTRTSWNWENVPTWKESEEQKKAEKVTRFSWNRINKIREAIAAGDENEMKRLMDAKIFSEEFSQS